MNYLTCICFPNYNMGIIVSIHRVLSRLKRGNICKSLECVYQKAIYLRVTTCELLVMILLLESYLTKYTKHHSLLVFLLRLWIISLIHATFLILTSFNTSSHSVLWPKSPWGGTLWAPEPQIYLLTGHYYLDTSNNLWKISKTELIIFLPKCMPIILAGWTGLKSREISGTPF